MSYFNTFLFGILFCLVSVPATAAEIKLVTVEYPPYYGPDLMNEGPITEIVSEAFRKVGYQVKVKYVPWARALNEAKSGKADGLHGGWYSKEREQWFVYSDKLPGNEMVFYKRRGAKPQSFTSYDDLRPFKIGVVRGYLNPPDFDAANLTTDVANSDSVNLTKLAKKRVDLILIDRAVSKYLLANELPEHADSLEAIEPPVELTPLYLLISKKTLDYQKKVDEFNRGLKLLTDEGGIEAIMKRHGQ